jgi:hypothetical protein
MGSISVACYKPKAGCEEALRELVRNHLPPLRAAGLVTERASIVMRAADGTIVEVFEWVSQEAIAGGHTITLWSLIYGNVSTPYARTRRHPTCRNSRRCSRTLRRFRPLPSGRGSASI